MSTFKSSKTPKSSQMADKSQELDCSLVAMISLIKNVVNSTSKRLTVSSIGFVLLPCRKAGVLSSLIT